MDPEFQALRINMQDRICKWLERKQTNPSSEWKQRLPDIVKRLEESVFKESLNKDDYLSKFRSRIESLITNVLNQKTQNQIRQQQLHQQQQNYQQSNSSVSGMMIPTPGISHNPIGTIRMSSSMDSNQGMNPTSGPAGTMSNGYQLSQGNMSINQPGNTSMSTSIGFRRQVMPQMIPTPGFNSTSTAQVTQQTMPTNSDYNNGSEILGADSGMLPLMQPQKQQPYNSLSGQVGSGMRSVPMNQKHSSQGFGHGMMNNNNGLGLLGNNMQQPMNGPGMSEGYMGIGGTYGNPTKPLQQGFSSQKIQQRMPTSLSQQGVSLMGDNTATKQVDTTMSSSGNYYNPAGPSNMSSASNLNKISAVAASLQSKPRPNMLTTNHQGGIHQIQQALNQTIQQPIVKSGPFSHPEKVNFQPYSQMSSQLNSHLGGNQLHQPSMQQQQQPMMTRGGNVTFSSQSSLGSIGFVGSLGAINTDQVISESALLTNNDLMLPQPADFQGQFFGPLAGSNASNQTVQSDELSSHNGVVNGRSRGGVHQPDSMLVQQQPQWCPTQQMQQVQQMQRNNHQMVADNNNHNSNALIEKNPTGTMRLSSSMDPELQALRINMQDRICKWLESKQTNPSSSSEWKERFPDIVKKLEECIFKASLNKDDYMSKFQSRIESLITNVLNQKNQNQIRQQQLHQQQQLQQQNHQQTMAHHNIQSNNSVSGMMITTPAISSEGVRARGPTVTTTVVPNKNSSQLSQQETQNQNQLKLILSLYHARHCRAPVGHCPEKNCVKTQQLVKHINKCCQKQCQLNLCLRARKALIHFRDCREVNCPVCIPARRCAIMAKQESLALKSGSKKDLDGKEVNNKVETGAGLTPVQAPVALPASASTPLAVKHSQKGMNQLDSSSGVFSDQMDAEPDLMDVSNGQQQPHPPLQEPLPKRPWIDLNISPVSVNNTDPSFSAMQESFPIEQSTGNIPAKQEADVILDPALKNLQIASTVSDTSSGRMGYDLDGDVSLIRSSQTDLGPAGPPDWVNQEPSLLVENEERNDENASEAKQEQMEDGAARNSGRPTMNGVVSMIELFTPEQVRDHIKSLRQWVGQV